MRERKRERLSKLQVVLSGSESINKLLSLNKTKLGNWHDAKQLAKFKRDFSQEMKDYDDLKNDITNEYREKVKAKIDKYKASEKTDSNFSWVSFLNEDDKKAFENELNSLLHEWEFEIAIPEFNEDFFSKLFEKDEITPDDYAIYEMLGMVKE